VTAGGVFIAFEGGEGAGKSTQLDRLAAELRSRGHEVVTTREPGGTDAGAAIRQIVLSPATGELSPRAEALLYAADRAHHVDTVIKPALDRGAVVLTDRYVDSSLAYQGAGRPLDQAEVAHVNAWATGGLVPDLTVLLDIDPTEGLARAGDPDRLEAEPLEFHARVRQGFLRLAAAAPDRYVVVAAAGDPDAVADRVRAALQQLPAVAR
jgi:dTMP kinase